MTSDSGLAGRLFGRYRLESEISKGGMGRVYLAKLEGAHGFQKLVAVKVIHPHLAGDRHMLSMFLDEARVASLINHVNVCAVQDFGAQEGVPYLVMEHLDGASLADVLKSSSALTPQLAARIVAEAARGLHAAHELRGEDGKSLNVVHRDVSPQNLFLLREGAVKVLDFGIARMKGRLAQTQATELKGKIAYMAPEQISRTNVDRRADLWALGVVLWESTLGRRLFEGENFLHKIDRVLEAPIPRPRDFDRSFPQSLEDIVMGALERDVERRPASAAAFADDLERYLYSTGTPCGAAQVAAFMKECLADEEGPEEDREPSLSAVSGLQSGFGRTMSIEAEEPDPEPGRALPVEEGTDPHALPSATTPDLGMAQTLPAEGGPAPFVPRDQEDSDADPAETLPVEGGPPPFLVPGPEASEAGMGETLPVEGGPVPFVPAYSEASERGLGKTLPADGLSPRAQPTTPGIFAGESSGEPRSHQVSAGAVGARDGTTSRRRDIFSVGERGGAEASRFSSQRDDDEARAPSTGLKIAAVVSVVLALLACSTVVVLVVVRQRGERASRPEPHTAGLIRAEEADAEFLVTSTDVPGVPVEERLDVMDAAPSLGAPLDPGDTSAGDVADDISADTLMHPPVQRAKARTPIKRHSVRPSSPPRNSTETGHGTLNLLVIPPSDVFFQGRSIGRTPLVRQRLPAGRHVLRIRPTDGRPPRSLPVVIRAGQTTKRTLRLN